MSTSRLRFTIALLACSTGTALAQESAEVRAERQRATSIGVEYSRVSLSGGIDPWSFASVSLGRRERTGSLIGRVNYADRQGSSGTQVEVDAYPRLTASTYAYVSVGYSGSAVFPEWRSGAELFTTLPQAWELSAGYRQLRYGGAPITLLTGALGKYAGNAWVSLRPYVRSDATGTTASATVTARRYFADGDHFVGARAGYGSTPPDQVSPDPAALTRTRSMSAHVHGSGDVSTRVLGTWSLGAEREELASARVRRSWSVTTGLRVRL